MEPAFLLSYWRPWNENSSLVDNWGDYIKDKSKAEYEAGIIGGYIKAASREQVYAIEQASREQVYAIEDASQRQVDAINFQTETIAHIGELQLLEIRKAAKNIGLRISEVKDELSFLNRKMDITLEQQRLSLVLQNDIAQLLKIPDSEKERQQVITLGIQFFVNASKDPDFFDDALEQFLIAEKMKKQDYFVLHRIGCIYLYSAKHLNPKMAIDYFTRAGKYAYIESSPDSIRLANLLTNPINQTYIQQTSDPKQIMHLAADSYEKAALASYIIGDDTSAVSFQEKAVALDKTAINSFNLAKYMIRCNKVSQAIPQLEWAIDNEASMIDAIFCDGDIASEPEAIKLVNKKSLELDNKIEEAIINSSLSPSKRSIGGKLLSLSYSKIGSLSHNNSYVEKRKAYETYEIERDPSTISKLEETIKSLRNSLNSFFSIGLLTQDKYDELSGKLSVKNIKSVAEGLSECEIVQKDLMEHRPKAGDNVKGGIIISYSTDTNKGLMCAKKRLGPTIFSYDTIKEAFIKTLISTSSGKENTNILLYYGSSQAAKTCEDYNAGGYDDWFLPTSSELIHHNNNQLKELMRNVWTSTGVESDAFDRAHSHSWGIIYLDDESEIAVESRYSTVEHFVLPVREFSIDL